MPPDLSGLHLGFFISIIPLRLILNANLSFSKKGNIMETLKAMALRQSVRAYTKEQISDAMLQTVLQAAYAAPVARGKFEDLILTVVQNEVLLDRIREAAAGCMDNPNANPTYSAPTLIIVATKLNEENEITPIACSNAGCLVENMTLAATDLNLGSVVLFGFIRAMNMQNLLAPMINLPKGYAPVAGIGIGYSAAALTERSLPTEKIKTSYIK